MRFPRLLVIHRWISLAFVALWILQAASGLAIGFRADIDDFFLGQDATATNAEALEKAVTELQANGDNISSIWISGGREGQYDAYLTRDGEHRTVRIDGAGTFIRDRSDEQLFSDGAIFETLTQFHKSLMLGNTGYIIFFISGCLLLSNICLGLWMGWPRRKRLKGFTKTRKAPSAITLSGWHWRIGFWGLLPALVVISAGIALNQADFVENTLGVEEASPERQDYSSGTTISLATAIETALAEYPGSTLVAINLPSDDSTWYKFRLNAPGEMPRLYGATRVFVGLDGEVLLTHDAANSAFNARIAEALYPVHTGQIGGLVGRLVNTAVGIWLLVMMYLGLRLWMNKRQRSGAASPSP